MRPTYNRGERVRARSVGPNPTGAAKPNVSISLMKKNKIVAKEIIVEEGEFNSVLSRLLKAKPVPMKTIKTTGKRPKGSLFPKRSES
jgi:hypothetical protein